MSNQIAYTDGTNVILVGPNTPLPTSGGGGGGGGGGNVVVTSSALPTGAATAANQTTANTSLASIVTNTGNAATAANQTTANTSLATVATQTTNSASAAGTTADTAYAGSGNTTLVGALKGIYAKLAASIAVTGTFWQATQPVSAVSLPLPTGAATSANQSTEITSLASIVTNTAVLGSKAVGAANIATGQISVGSTATLIAAARTGAPGTGRVDITIVNWSTVDVFLGGSGVTTSNGMKLPGVLGASITITVTSAIYGIVATGTESISYIETY